MKAGPGDATRRPSDGRRRGGKEGSRNHLKKKARTRRGGARREAPIRHADVGVVVVVVGVGGVFDRDDARDP